MSLRILHISTRLILGGSQENTILSCEGQAALGHEVHLAFGTIYGPEGTMKPRVEAFNAKHPDNPVGLHEVLNLVREVSPVRDARARAQLRELIARLRPDIVHTHSSKAGILGRLAAWDVSLRLPIGIVHTVHGPPFMPIEGGAFRHLRIGLTNAVYARAERLAAKRCDVIVGVADAMAQQFLARRIGRPEQYQTVRSGMETQAFLDAPLLRDATRAELGIGPGDFVIGTVARLAQHKGHDDLLDALADDLRQEPSWKLLWVGDGWWRERLLERAERAGLRDRIIVTGLVPPERIPAMLSAMDLLAHPSSREGLPRTVPQALLAGVCPVAYDADGTREACIDGETGRLVPVGDTRGLGEAIRTLARDPARRAALADRGRAMCRTMFSAETMVRELEAVYDRALVLAAHRGNAHRTRVVADP